MKMTPNHPFRSAKARERFLEQYDTMAKRWPVPSETRMVDTSFGSTFVRISGKDGASPLVLLHGVGGNSLQWMPNIEELSRGHCVYAVDNIYDNGRSICTRPVTSIDDFVTWLDELFTALGLDSRVNLMGLSYGGWLAGWCAHRLGHRLDKVILLAPAFTVLPLRTEFLVRAILCMVPLRFITRSFLYWICSDFIGTGQPARAAVKESADFAFIALRAFKWRKMVKPAMLSDVDLADITVPILFMVGENEKIYSARDAVRHLNTVAPHIRAVVIPGAGHDLTLVQAEMVNKKVREFLGQP